MSTMLYNCAWRAAPAHPLVHLRPRVEQLHDAVVLRVLEADLIVDDLRCEHPVSMPILQREHSSPAST